MSAFMCEGQKGTSCPQELECDLSDVGVLWKAAATLNHWAVSPTPSSSSLRTKEDEKQGRTFRSLKGLVGPMCSMKVWQRQAHAGGW